MISWDRFRSEDSHAPDPVSSRSPFVSGLGSAGLWASRTSNSDLLSDCGDHGDGLSFPIHVNSSCYARAASDIFARSGPHAWLVVGGRVADASSFGAIVIDCHIAGESEGTARTESLSPRIEKLKQMRYFTYDVARFIDSANDLFQPAGASVRFSGSEIALADSRSASGAHSAPTRTPDSLLPFWAVKVGYLDGAKEFHKALMEVTRQTERVKRDGSHTKFMHQLESLELSDFSEFVLVGLLRNTFAFRTTLPRWSEFRDRVAAELEQRDLEVKVSVLLRGMLDAAREA